MADGTVKISTELDNSTLEKGLASLGNTAKKGLAATTKIIAGAGTALLGLGAGAAKVGMDFEASMSQVAATMGITSAEIAAGSEAYDILSNAAKEMGASTQFSASQASEALNYLALAGYDAATAADVLPSVLNLAAAGGMDLAYASDLATDAMSALGIEASQANLAKFGDELAVTAQKSNTSVSQLGEAILTVGGTAKILSGGTNELNTALGILADNGIKGAEGGTALRNMILSLSAPTDKTAKELEKLGVQAFDAEGNMRPLNETFSDLNESLGSLSAQERQQSLSNIFNKVDLKSADALLANCGDRFDELSGYIGNADGAMEDMAETMNDNLKGSITIAKSALEGLGITAYEQIQGPLRSAVETGTGYIDQLSEAFSGGLSEGVASLGSIFADIATQIAKQAPKMIKTASNMVKSFINGIRSAIPQIAKSGVEIVSSLVEGIITTVPLILQGALELMFALANGLTDAIPELIPRIVEVMTSIVDGFLSNIPMLIEAALQLIVALAQGLLAAIPVLIEAVPKIITSYINALLSSIPLIIQAGIDLLTALVEALPEIITAIVEAIPLIIDGIISALLENIPLIIQSGIDLLTALIQALPEIIVTIVQAIPDIISGIITALLDNIPLIIEAGVMLFVSLIENLPTIIIEILKAVPQIVMGIVDAFASLAHKFVEIGGNILQGIWQGICDAATWLFDKVTGFFGGLVDKVKGFLGIHSPSRVFSDIGGDMASGVGVGFDKNMSGVEKDMKGAVGSAGSVTAEEALTAVNDGMVSNVKLLQKAVTAVVDEITNGLKSKNHELKKRGNEFAKMIADGISSGISTINTQVKAVVNSMTSILNNSIQTFYSIGQNMARGLGSGFESQKGRLNSQVQGMMNSITASAKAAMEIHSPSRVFAEIGEFMAAGISVGFAREMKAVRSDIDVEMERAASIKGIAAKLVNAQGGRRIVSALQSATDSESAESSRKIATRNVYSTVSTKNITEKKETSYVQNLEINSPEPLSPAETARQTRNATQHFITSVVK